MRFISDHEKMNFIVILASVLCLLAGAGEACLGDGCVYHRERDQFFWCSGRVGEETNSIRSWYGDLSRAALESFCTEISSMLVTTAPDLLAVARGLCGPGQHEVICHEDISRRGP